MKKIIIALASVFLITSCASVVHGTSARFNLEGKGKISVFDSYGNTVAEGKDRLVVNLKRGKGFLSGASYMVVSGDKKVFIEPFVNIGAFGVGNFFVPTFLGYIIDGANGAMWDLKVNGIKTNYINLK